MLSRRSGSPADAEASSSHSKYGETRQLNLGCRIFISHSGRDKNFVRHLHEKLVDRYYDDGSVFFDEKSLPTAEPISMKNILAEARGCKLGVLVLSEDFFMHTPNPMLELETLTANEVRLLPLFLKISVDEFKKMRCNNVWEDQWKEWLKGDEERLRVWKHALGFVDRFCGLEYCKLASNDLEFIHKVVAQVAQIVRPNLPFSEEGFRGMGRLCEIVNGMYEQCASNRVSDGGTQVVSTSASAGRREDSGKSYDLVGIYGFAGLGKSTLSRCLCNYYFVEFHGKVCWLDLGSVPDSSKALSQTNSSENNLRWRMEYLLSKLITGPVDYTHSTFFEIQNLVRNWITKKPIFLAIDNISSDSNSLEEVDFYLSCNFAKGSKVFITARSEKTLEQVTRECARFSTVIEHIPKLKFEEARGILVEKIPKNLQISNMEDEVKECVNMCVIYLQYYQTWYHPLMLKSFAASIRYDRRRTVDLKLKLREFIQSALAIDKSDARKAVFDFLDITSYAILSDEAKKVFLDLSLFHNILFGSSYEWIQCVYSHVNTNEIFSSLEDLCFIDISKDKYGYECAQRRIGMHDLMVDFAKYKLMKQGAGFTPQYLVVENDAQLRNHAAFAFLSGARNEWPSISALPNCVRTVSISWCSSDHLDLRSLEGVEVLHLVGNTGVQEVLLSRNTLAQLRSLIIFHFPQSECLRVNIDEDWPTQLSTASQIQMGGKLMWIKLYGNVIFSTYRKSRPAWWSGRKQSLLQRLLISWSTAAPRAAVCGLGTLQPLFCNPQYLELSQFPATSIDFTTCTNLKSLHLRDMPGLQDIHGLERLNNLDKLEISNCDKLLRLRIPANSRLSARVFDCKSMERISLLETSNPEADRSACGASHGGSFTGTCYPALRKVDGIVQYTGKWCSYLPHKGEPSEGMQGAIQDLMEPFETDASMFKANVKLLEFEGYPVQGLAGLTFLDVQDVRHVHLLISALVKAQPTGLQSLGICCGCDINEPHFGPGELPSCHTFYYSCPQVRNVASLSLWLGGRVYYLSLRGCFNIEVWPDFATMTSLHTLDLRYTSLKECPIGPAQLRQLRGLGIAGCWQLPAEERMKAITCNPDAISYFKDSFAGGVKGSHKDNQKSGKLKSGSKSQRAKFRSGNIKSGK